MKVLLLLALFAISAFAEDIVAVLSASSGQFRLRAYHHNVDGLVLFRIPRHFPESLIVSALTAQQYDELKAKLPPAKFLGLDASFPTFDDNGDLYFIRSTDDGYQVLTREDWVLVMNHKTPMPVSAGDEGIPENIQKQRAATAAMVAGFKASNTADDEKAARKAPFKITVDPGHGGSDPGAVAQGYEEEFFNRDVSLRLRDLLNADRGLWTVQMTRTTDVDVSLEARVNMANNWPADRFVSVHTNSFTSNTAQGTETYSYPGAATSARLRDAIQAEAIKAWGLVNRGSKTADFYVLRETAMPATLSEMGFITSPIDILKLSDPNARQAMAQAHLNALRFHFGVFAVNQTEIEN